MTINDAAEYLSETETGEGRRLVLTAASDIEPMPVFWLMEGRIALGALSLVAGREGRGKSTVCYDIAARVTRGTLVGDRFGRPQGVLIAATEDSWAHTIVPRLMAAGADLDRVFRIEILTSDDVHGTLTLPKDLRDLEFAAAQVDAALLILDPLMSRLGDLDTHRDGEVRRALEPLVAIAERADMAIIGLIHHNKSDATDPLRSIMASVAFTAVARSVSTVMLDPDDETEQTRLFGTPKNNLGRSDLPTLAFSIVEHSIPTRLGPATTSRVEWGNERAESIQRFMERTTEDRTAVGDASEWLAGYLAGRDDGVPSRDVMRDGEAEGHSADALKRAKKRLGVRYVSSGFPRTTRWFAADVTTEKGPLQ